MASDPITEAKPLGPPVCPGDDVDGFVSRVVSFEPGPGAGFGQELFPEVVFGPPEGGGELAGSVDVLSLGSGGEIILEMSSTAIDCEGPDFVVFENAFATGSITYAELAEVSVSIDGRVWHTFECASASGWPFEGCAGVGVVNSEGPEGEIVDPRDPMRSGGDAFDLADVGIDRARFVRLRDLNIATGISAPPSKGFDLDAISIVAGHAETR